MAKYRIKSFGRGSRGVASVEQVIEAIAQRRDGKTLTECMAPIYEKAGKDIPEKLSAVFGAWKSRINKLLDSDNEQVIKLCQDAEIVEPWDGVKRKIIRKQKTAAKK